MRFWLRRGVDGFRVDVIWHLIKDVEFRDNPPNPHYLEGRPPHEKILTQYSTDQPEVHEVIAEMRRVIDEFDDRVLIGEIYLPLHRLVAYYGNDLAGAQMPFNFALLSTLWNARSIEKIIADYERALPAGSMAELGTRQSRSSEGCKPCRNGSSMRTARCGCRQPMLAQARRETDKLLPFFKDGLKRKVVRVREAPAGPGDAQPASRPGRRRRDRRTPKDADALVRPASSPHVAKCAEQC